MKSEDYNLNNIPKENPFRVPEGYMEGLTARIMKQIPKEEPQIEHPDVSLMDKIRPILYLAAMFAGLGLFFKAIAYFDNNPNNEAIASDTLLVGTELPEETQFTLQETYDEDEEYLAYIENQYANALMQEELGEE